MYVLFPKINKTNMAVAHFLHPNSTAIHYVLFMILSTVCSYAMLLQIDNSVCIRRALQQWLSIKSENQRARDFFFFLLVLRQVVLGTSLPSTVAWGHPGFKTTHGWSTAALLKVVSLILQESFLCYSGRSTTIALFHLSTSTFRTNYDHIHSPFTAVI